MNRFNRLERLLGRLLFVGVVASASLLAAGLALDMAPGARDQGAPLLHAGLILLMATPVARVVVSLVEYTRRRDWLFAAATFGVLAVLAATAAVAIRTAMAG